MKWGKRTTHAMVNLFVVRASARIPGTRYGLKAALQTPHFIRLKCYGQPCWPSAPSRAPLCLPKVRLPKARVPAKYNVAPVSGTRGRESRSVGSSCRSFFQGISIPRRLAVACRLSSQGSWACCPNRDGQDSPFVVPPSGGLGPAGGRYRGPKTPKRGGGNPRGGEIQVGHIMKRKIWLCGCFFS